MRTRAGLSQGAVAERLAVTRQTITAWEGGDSEPPAIDLQRLAALFGVDVNVLLGLAALPLE